MPDSQIGVLIDYENVGLGYFGPLFDELSDIGRIIVKRAYADWSMASDKGNQMIELGIEAKQVFRASASAKNSSDISLAIDAIDLLHRSPVDTFVIVSSDTDFVPLVSTLRAAGKTVIGAGRRGVVSPGLVRSCDRYIFLDDGKPTAKDHTALKAAADSLLTRAVEASADAQGQVVAAKLHNTMLRMDPSFDFRAIGHRFFTQFLTASTAIKLNRPRGGGDVMVELTPTKGHVELTPTKGHVELTPTKGHIEMVVGDSAQAGSGDSVQTRSWDTAIDSAWSNVPGDTISGSKAAAEAAKVLSVSKLSVSRYRSLQGLLDASELLRARWSRDGNTVLRRPAVHI